MFEIPFFSPTFHIPNVNHFIYKSREILSLVANSVFFFEEYLQEINKFNIFLVEVIRVSILASLFLYYNNAYV